MDTFLVIFWGIVLLALVVFLHELGHFLAARACGVRVTEFMIGLPGPSIGFMHNGTRFGVTAIPLGGYARIAGMETGEEDPLLADVLAYVYRQGSTNEEQLAQALDIDEERANELLIILSGWGSITTPRHTLTAKTYLAPATLLPRSARHAMNVPVADTGELTIPVYALGEAREVTDPHALLDEQRKGTYRALPCWKRLCILFAGPLANIITAVIVIVLLLSAHGVYEVSTTIADVVPDSPAATAGIIGGDTIVQIDENNIATWTDLEQAIATYEAGDTVDVTFEREGTQTSVQLTLYKNEIGSAAMGVYAGSELVHMSVIDSLATSGEYIVLVVQAIVNLFNPATAQTTLESSVSVVGIAYEAKAAADAGILSFLMIAISISVSLGLMNLLPIPPLDGGKIVIEVVQKIIRREVPMKVSNALTIFGVAFVAILFVVLLVQDVGRYIVG